MGCVAKTGEIVREAVVGRICLDLVVSELLAPRHGVVALTMSTVGPSQLALLPHRVRGYRGPICQYGIGTHLPAHCLRRTPVGAEKRILAPWPATVALSWRGTTKIWAAADGCERRGVRGWMHRTYVLPARLAPQECRGSAGLGSFISVHVSPADVSVWLAPLHTVRQQRLTLRRRPRRR